MTTREKILAAVRDAAADFMYYDRKEDEDLPVGVIEEAVYEGEITVLDIVDAFTEAMGL